MFCFCLQQTFVRCNIPETTKICSLSMEIQSGCGNRENVICRSPGYRERHTTGSMRHRTAKSTCSIVCHGIHGGGHVSTRHGTVLLFVTHVSSRYVDTLLFVTFWRGGYFYGESGGRFFSQFIDGELIAGKRIYPTPQCFAALFGKNKRALCGSGLWSIPM